MTRRLGSASPNLVSSTRAAQGNRIIIVREIHITHLSNSLFLPQRRLSRKQPRLRVLGEQREAAVSSPIHLAHAFVSATLPAVIYIYGFKHKYKLLIPDLVNKEARVARLLLTIDHWSIASP